MVERSIRPAHLRILLGCKCFYSDSRRWEKLLRCLIYHDLPRANPSRTRVCSGWGLFDRCGSVWWGHRIAGRPVGDPDARQEGKADWAAGGKAEAHTSVLHRRLSFAADTNKKPCCLHRPHGNKAPILLISAVRFGPGHGKARGSSRKT